MKCSFSAIAAVVAAGFISVGAQAAPRGTDAVIPLIELNNVPLVTAIRDLARQASLNVLLDPRLAEPPFQHRTVSVRWKDVTAREALEALLDNHGLVLVASPRP